MRRWGAKLLRFLGGLLVGLLLAIGGITLAIYLSRGTILQWLVTELSRTFSARIALSEVQIGRWRDLPALSLRLTGFTLQTLKGEDTLFTATEVLLYLNLWEALVEKKYRIESLSLREPSLWLRYDARGYSPWQSVLRKDTSSGSPWSIEKLHIQDGKLLYEDIQAAFALHLSVQQVKTRIQYQAENWNIRGKIEGAVESLRIQKTSWLSAQPFVVEGTLLYEGEWLLPQGLTIRTVGLSTQVDGGIRLTDPRPILSLRLSQVALEVEALRPFWPQIENDLQNLQGSLKGSGEIQGPIGKGELPRLHIEAALHIPKPFTLRSYPVRHLRAHGLLHWDPQSPRQNLLRIDSLYFIGGQQDTLTGAFTLYFMQGEGRATLAGQLDLSHLRQAGIPHTDSLAGLLQASLHAVHKKSKWSLSGQGTLIQGQWKEIFIPHVQFSVTPTALTLYEGVIQHPAWTLHTSELRIQNYARLWDTTVPPLHLEGRLRLPKWMYVSSDTGSPSSIPPFTANLDIRIDTFSWDARRYGPIEGRVRWLPDTLFVDLHRLEGVAGGKLKGRIVKEASHWRLQGELTRLSLEKLHKEWPELDTLFPLLPHLRGIASGMFEASFSMRRNRLAWAEAQGSFSLLLSDFVVVESPYTYRLFSLIPLTDFKRIEVGRVEARCALTEGVLRLDTTYLQANRWRMQVAGSHTLQGELAYDLLVEVPRVLLDKSSSRIQEWVEETEGDRLRLAIQVRGTAEDPSFRWKTAGSTSTPSKSDKEEPTSRKKRKARSPLPVEEN